MIDVLISCPRWENAHTDVFVSKGLSHDSMHSARTAKVVLTYPPD